MMTHSKITQANRGFTLLEVVLAIAVFAFGMLALVELQTGLARSGSDANMRTVASNIAEEQVEDARGFTQITADPTNGRTDYNEIVSDTRTVSRGNLDYTVDLTVTDYYWDADSETFTTTQPTGIVNSDYKTMDIVVMWRDPTGGEDFSDHDTIDFGAGGGVRIVEAVPSTPGLLGALVASERENVGAPTVDYNPGDNPDIVRITLDADNHKFKESTNVMPDVIRTDKVETWFDVVTYSQVNSQASFLRREEFVTVSCDCELNNSPDEADWGRKPTLWNGVTYTEGEKVDKPIGTVPGGVQQSAYCTVCCRDHHDGAGSGEEDVYNLDNVGSTEDHPHYDRDNRGLVIDTEVSDGDAYVEACRLVRKDGFMRVTQDANQGTLIGFPEGYLDFDAGANEYSAYVVDAVSGYYGGTGSNFQNNLLQPNPPDSSSAYDAFPARTTTNGTNLPTPNLFNSQQLRARGLYVDYLTQAAQDVISECFPLDSRSDDCPATNTTSPLEIYPFFDVQMTKLARWNIVNGEDQIIETGLIDVSNDPIATNNTHSRGLATLISEDGGQSTVLISSHKGNLGLTATGAIDPNYANEINKDHLYVNANLDDTPAPSIGYVVTGSLGSGVRRVRASDLSINGSDGVFCGQTDTDWACVLNGSGTVTIGNYYLNNPTVYVCSSLGTGVVSGGTTVATATTTFSLPGAGATDQNIWISENADCSL
ncbi:MAG: prepilin-type N-terminal cleavage/methylation domain-containing protein [Lysobacterales bacterium]|jgi:prepilin-type N-terminal cleavage/methylation domain-containing protein